MRPRHLWTLSHADPHLSLSFTPAVRLEDRLGWCLGQDVYFTHILGNSNTSILSLMEYGGWESYPGLSMHCPVHTSWQFCEVITGVITHEERGSEKESHLSTNTVICLLGNVKCPWVPEWWFHNMSDIKVVMTKCHRSLYSHYRIGFLVLLVLKEWLVDSESFTQF